MDTTTPQAVSLLASTTDATRQVAQATSRAMVEHYWRTIHDRYVHLEQMRLDTPAVREAYQALKAAVTRKLAELESPPTALIPCEAAGTTTLPEAIEAARRFFATDTDCLVVSITFNVDGEAVTIDRALVALDDKRQSGRSRQPSTSVLVT